MAGAGHVSGSQVRHREQARGIRDVQPLLDGQRPFDLRPLADGADPEGHERVLLRGARGALGGTKGLHLVEVRRVLGAVERVRALGAVVLGALGQERLHAGDPGGRELGELRRGRAVLARAVAKGEWIVSASAVTFSRGEHRCRGRVPDSDAGVLRRAIRDRGERGVEERLEVGLLVRERAGEHAMGSRRRGRDLGRIGPGLEQAEVRLVPPGDRVDGVVDRTVHHRQVQVRHRGRDAGCAGRCQGVHVPVEDDLG